MGVLTTFAVLGFAVFYYYTATKTKRESKKHAAENTSPYPENDDSVNNPPNSQYYPYPNTNPDVIDAQRGIPPTIPPTHLHDDMMSKYRSENRMDQDQDSLPSNESNSSPHSHSDYNDPTRQYYQPHPAGTAAPPPHLSHPMEDQESNRSLISAGYSVGSDSIIEQDATNLLLDEFDEYRHENLEKMRETIVDSIPESADMVSQAMTKAFMLEYDDLMELLGSDRFSDHLVPLDREVTELCSTNEWKRKRQGASEEEKRLFLQSTLNKMAAFVMQGVMPSEDAARTIHECAAMLGLPLYTDIEKTTLIVTGLRKTAEKSYLRQSFKEFGEIVGVAVARGQRGFGMVRFMSTKSVQRAKEKFNKEEIVVQDVGVMIKVLESEAPILVERRSTPTPSFTPQNAQNAGGTPQRQWKPQAPTNYPVYNEGRDTIGYPDGSFGSRYDSTSKSKMSRGSYPSSGMNAPEWGSDSGMSTNSFGSSKRSHHSRNPSGGGASITSSGTSGGPRRKLM